MDCNTNQTSPRWIGVKENIQQNIRQQNIQLGLQISTISLYRGIIYFLKNKSGKIVCEIFKI